MPYFSFNRNWRQGVCNEEVFYLRQETSIEVELLFGKLEFFKISGPEGKKERQSFGTGKFFPSQARLFKKLGWISRVSMKSDFKSESYQREFTGIPFVQIMIIGYSKKSKENYPKKDFELRNKETQIKNLTLGQC